MLYKDARCDIFQSTLPRRERRVWHFAKTPIQRISIHAPAKGATLQELDAVPDAADFNPRSREGSDRGRRWQNPDRRDFNPRSREGSDLTDGIALIYFDDFNPRSREGSDPIPNKTVVNNIISIHAPAKGAT